MARLLFSACLDSSRARRPRASARSDAEIRHVSVYFLSGEGLSAEGGRASPRSDANPWGGLHGKAARAAVSIRSDESANARSRRVRGGVLPSGAGRRRKTMKHQGKFPIAFVPGKVYTMPRFQHCSGGEIGRHVCLRCIWVTPCGFESRPEHHFSKDRVKRFFFLV
jgi:hypothetical protein